MGEEGGCYSQQHDRLSFFNYQFLRIIFRDFFGNPARIERGFYHGLESVVKSRTDGVAMEGYIFDEIL